MSVLQYLVVANKSVSDTDANNFGCNTPEMLMLFCSLVHPIRFRLSTINYIDGRTFSFALIPLNLFE